MDRSSRNVLTSIWLYLCAAGGLILGLALLATNWVLGLVFVALGLFMGVVAKEYAKHEAKKRVIREALTEFEEDRRL